MTKYRQQRDVVLTLLGGKCVRCGFDDFRALQIDHVKGNGCKHPISDYKLAVRILRVIPAAYQILCANCNWIKRAENNEHRKPSALNSQQPTRFETFYQTYREEVVTLLDRRDFTETEIARWFCVKREVLRQIVALEAER